MQQHCPACNSSTGSPHSALIHPGKLCSQVNRDRSGLQFVCGLVVAVGVIAMLRFMHPDEDFAGIVIVTFLLSGLLFASIGYLVQKQLKRR